MNKKSKKQLAKIILFFNSNFKPRLYLSQLHRLLFYTQFLYHKEYGEKLLNINFLCAPSGFVAKGLGPYLSSLEESKLLILEDTELGVIVNSNYSLKEEVYGENEFIILHKVCSKFNSMYPSEMIEYIHQEDIWKMLGFDEVTNVKYSCMLNDFYL